MWEFIRELLESNEDGAVEEREQLVRWENRAKGVFLIVNSREVAELWGKRKRNSTMTYEKLSRSLRYRPTYTVIRALLIRHNLGEIIGIDLITLALDEIFMAPIRGG